MHALMVVATTLLINGASGCSTTNYKSMTNRDLRRHFRTLATRSFCIGALCTNHEAA